MIHQVCCKQLSPRPAWDKVADTATYQGRHTSTQIWRWGRGGVGVVIGVVKHTDLEVGEGWGWGGDRGGKAHRSGGGGGKG